MGVRDLRRKLTATVDELDEQRLQVRFQGLGLTEIGGIVVRRPTRVGGEVKGTRLQPRSGVPAIEITIHDGTGKISALFTGRRRVPGLEQGRAVVLEGVPFHEHGRLMMLNPAYTLLPS